MIRYDDLIGVPFKIGGRGPDFYDCYGLLVECYRRFGAEIPDYASPSAGPVITALISGEAARLWVPCKAKEGATVLIKTPHSLHVGFMLDERYMLHAWQDSHGVTREPIDTWKRRIIGFYEYGKH